MTDAAAPADAPTSQGLDAAAAGGAAGLRARVQALVGPDSRLRRRFVAWWEGDDPPPAAPRAGKPDAPEPPPANAAPGAPVLPDRWSAPRVRISELIWGDGFSFPGGVDHVLKLVKPMGLTKEKSMLDLGSGLGGASRVIAKTFGTWVTGMEMSKTLAQAGMAASEKAGLAKKAPIEWFDPETVLLPARKFDAVFSRLVLLWVKEKQRLIGEMNKALKPGGHLMFLELVEGGKDKAGKALEAWRSGEDHAPLPGSRDAYAAVLKGLKLDVRVAEDVTPEFRGLVLEGWARLAQSLKPGSLAPDEAAALAHEVELWTRRVAALESGALAAVRFYAIKRG